MFSQRRKRLFLANSQCCSREQVWFSFVRASLTSQIPPWHLIYTYITHIPSGNDVMTRKHENIHSPDFPRQECWHPYLGLLKKCCCRCYQAATTAVFCMICDWEWTIWVEIKDSQRVAAKLSQLSLWAAPQQLRPIWPIANRSTLLSRSRSGII